MLNVFKELRNQTLNIRLVGSIDESVSFEDIMGKAGKSIIVRCQEVSRINSHGVRSWIKYFQAIIDDGIEVQFHECSPAIVQQLNLVGKFIPERAKIISICAPYFCASCKNHFTVVFKTEEISKISPQVPEKKCQKCGNTNAQFDDIESEYFGYFLNKNP